MKQDELDKDLKDLLSESTRLFGDVDEMDQDELKEILNDSDRPAEAVRNEMFRALEKFTKELRLPGETAPKRYLDAMNQLRPPSALSPNPDALAEQAKTWVRGLLSGTGTVSGAKLQFSFRNKGEFTKGDQRILEEAEDEVRRKIEKKQ
jgi:hypothetical protein